MTSAVGAQYKKKSPIRSTVKMISSNDRTPSLVWSHDNYSLNNAVHEGFVCSFFCLCCVFLFCLFCLCVFQCLVWSAEPLVVVTVLWGLTWSVWGKCPSELWAACPRSPMMLLVLPNLTSHTAVCLHAYSCVSCVSFTPSVVLHQTLSLTAKQI